MKKHAAKVLLPLLFSCLFLFSGSLNVKVYANEITQPKFNSYYPNTESMNFEFFYSSGATGLVRSTRYNDWSFYFTNSDLANGLPNVSKVGFYFVADGWTNPVNTELYDYYLFINLFSQRDTSSSSSNYVPSDLIVKSGFYSDGVWNDEYTYPISDLEIIYSAGGQSGYPYGYNITAKIDMSERNTIGSIYVPFVNRSYIKGTFNAAFFILEVEKGYNESLNNIIAAITDQTDQITGVIEDQYSGSPESSFNTGDIITQHNEKMGVLSFGSDVMLQFLDLFQSANVGAAQLTLPGFNITVQDVNYQVWEDQTFNFSQLEQWVPGLIDVIRLMLPAFVWLMVLRYCIQVSERNFLSK